MLVSQGRRRTSASFIEPLERRQLLSAGMALAATTGASDLTFSSLTPKINSSLVAGAATHGTAKASVELTGAALAKGSVVTVQLFWRPIAAVDGSTDVPASTVSSLRSIRPGVARTISFKVTADASLNGDYHLVATVDAGNLIAESDEANNSLVSPATVLISAPFTDIAVTTATETFPSSAKVNSHGRVTVSVADEGNVKANGTITFSFLLTGADDSVVSLTAPALSRHVVIPNGAVRKYAYTLKLPATLTDQSYILSGAVAAGGGIVDSNPANNGFVFSSNPITIIPTSTPGKGGSGNPAVVGLTIWKDFFVLAGRNVGSSLYDESGSVDGADGDTGTYSFNRFGAKDFLSVGVVDFGLYNPTIGDIHFYSPVKTMDGRSVTIVGSRAGASGYFTVKSNSSLSVLTRGTYYFVLT